MNNFFEITPDDIYLAAYNHLGITLTEERAEELANFDEETENRLLNGIDNLSDLDEQTEAVHEAIAEWLKEEGRLNDLRQDNQP